MGHADIRTIKNDVKENSSQVSLITLKISNLERNHERSELDNLRKFDELKTGLAQVESSVTAKLICSMEPQLTNLRSELSAEMRAEMKDLLKVEMEKTNLNKRNEEVQEESSSEEEEATNKGEPVKKKKSKISKKNSKNT